MTEPTTETEAVAELAVEAAGFTGAESLTDDDRLASVLTPRGWTRETIDLSRHFSRPARAAGEVRVHTADGFAAAVAQRLDTFPFDDAETKPTGALYRDDDAMALVAILNDDDATGPGWRDHRVALHLRKRPEWLEWRGIDGKYVGQEAFADFIEDHQPEILEPSPAAMLDLAQTFHATKSAKFKGGLSLARGDRSVVWEENTEAAAGANGNLVIPEALKLAVVPFYGADRYETTARFRYVVRDGNLALMVKLERPDDLERHAFAELADKVAETTGLRLVAGVAPPPR